MLLHKCSDVGADPAVRPALFDDEQPVGLCDRREDRVEVKWAQSARVELFAQGAVECFAVAARSWRPLPKLAGSDVPIAVDLAAKCVDAIVQSFGRWCRRAVGERSCSVDLGHCLRFKTGA